MRDEHGERHPARETTARLRRLLVAAGAMSRSTCRPFATTSTRFMRALSAPLSIASDDGLQLRDEVAHVGRIGSGIIGVRRAHRDHVADRLLLHLDRHPEPTIVCGRGTGLSGIAVAAPCPCRPPRSRRPASRRGPPALVHGRRGRGRRATLAAPSPAIFFCRKPSRRARSRYDAAEPTHAGRLACSARTIEVLTSRGARAANCGDGGWLRASRRRAPTTPADSDVKASMQCDCASEPGRVRCTVEARIGGAAPSPGPTSRSSRCPSSPRP